MEHGCNKTILARALNLLLLACRFGFHAYAT
nr:MAG TPA: hypothetical protein [Caudoviricetes sp.]